MTDWSDNDPEQADAFHLSEADRKFLLPRVAHAILPRIGRQSAIRARELVTLLGLRTDRKVRLIVRELVRSGHAIASTVAPPYGFYVVSNQNEAEEFERNLQSRIEENREHLNDFRKALVAKWGLNYQMVLIQDDGCKEMEKRQDEMVNREPTADKVHPR